MVTPMYFALVLGHLLVVDGVIRTKGHLFVGDADNLALVCVEAHLPFLFPPLEFTQKSASAHSELPGQILSINLHAVKFNLQIRSHYCK